MSNNQRFYPVRRLTPTDLVPAPELCAKMKDYMKPMAVVSIVPSVSHSLIPRHIVSVIFDGQRSTDLVSPEFIHSWDEMIKLIREKLLSMSI